MSCHIVILGAGISGLATAWFLKQSLGSQVHLTIIEKSDRAGGDKMRGAFLLDASTRWEDQKHYALEELVGKDHSYHSFY